MKHALEPEMHDHQCPSCNRPFRSESTAPNFCPYACGAIGNGYAAAFYELADMMGITAQPRSPKEVWEHEMKPRLAIALARDGEVEQAQP